MGSLSWSTTNVIILLITTLGHVSGAQLHNNGGIRSAEIDYMNSALNDERLALQVSPAFGSSKRRRATVIVERPGHSVETSDCTNITGVPAELRQPAHMYPKGLDNFYQKYTQAYGIPILGSSKVSDTALSRICYMVRFLLADRPDIRETFYKMFGRYGLMSVTEMTTDIPEHSYLDSTFWDARARGLGATRERPVSTGGEENALCLRADRYPKEDIALHECTHGVHLIAARYAIRDFDARLTALYNSAKVKGLWKNTYAMTNEQEYWAEAAQSFFNDDDIANPTNGIHNHIHTREGLRNYDPGMFALCQEIWPCGNTYLPRCLTSRELEEKQVLKMNCNGTNNPVFTYDSGCSDGNFNCPGWASSGECTKNPSYMLSNCAKSCRQCTTVYRGAANRTSQSIVEMNMSCNNTVNTCQWSQCKVNLSFAIENCRATCVNCAYYIGLHNRGAFTEMTLPNTSRPPFVSSTRANFPSLVLAACCLFIVVVTATPSP